MLTYFTIQYNTYDMTTRVHIHSFTKPNSISNYTASISPDEKR